MMTHTKTLIIALAIASFMPVSAHAAKATFAAGCFWCVEKAFDQVDGVDQTVSGYANGHAKNPSYDQVSSGGTGHVEAVQVKYDESKVSYRDLLEVYWANVDPVDDGGQFCDRGPTYRSAIIYHDERQKELAETSRQLLEKRYQLNQEVVTPIEPLESFYPAEEYHQNYHNKNSIRYEFYVWNCGRHNRLEQLWGDAEGERLDLFDNS